MWIDRQNSLQPEGQKYEVHSLYTEREPCGKGEGHAHCSVLLKDNEYMRGKNVYYSATYRDDPQGITDRNAYRQELKEKAAGEYAKANSLADEKARHKANERINNRIAAKVKLKQTDREVKVDAEMEKHLHLVAEVWAKSMKHVTSS